MTVPPNADLYSFAHKLLRERRDAACPDAIRRAEALLGQGDLSGYMLWRRIARTIEHIQRIERKSDTAA
jgi:hypothetical protein